MNKVFDCEQQILVVANRGMWKTLLYPDNSLDFVKGAREGRGGVNT